MKFKDMVHGAKCLVLGALCAVGLTAVAAEPEAVQLWEGGPYWATVNVGADTPEGYGILTNFNDAAKAVTDALGEEWRVPSKEELQKLCGEISGYCTKTWDSTTPGHTFTGATDGYKDKSIFLPAAGYNFGGGRKSYGFLGYYWSSEADVNDCAWDLYFVSNTAYVDNNDRILGLSVRAVKDPPPPVEYLDWDEVNKKPTNAVCSVYKEYTGQTTLVAGMTYVVKGAVTNLTSDVVVGGTAANPTRLILCDGAELFLQGQSAAETAGLGVASGNVLVIYGQAAGTGKLTAIGGGGAAGIGGGSSSAGGTVTINGGIITATGGMYGAGIGGGMAKNGGTVTINGGTVTATGSNGGAGIGVGYQGGDAGTVAFGAKFGVVAGADAGSATPIAQGDYVNNHSAAYVHIGPPTPGSKDNPWVVGEGVTAYTNGTELVIGGEGTITNLEAIPGAVVGAVEAITITEATVSVQSDAFQGIDTIALTLPDGWQGELPKDGNWYGATNVTLTAFPLAVKNVTFQQRYPWNGLVDIACDLTGAGEVTLKVAALTNGVTFVEATTLIGETTIDLGVAGGLTNSVKFIWNAAADLPAGFKQSGVSVKVTAEK